ncbi:MAG: hypothetical protein IMZ53_10550 [Thermoplasmata archaeon]|nr:hypothetical protein [Thermoplasmata archaeon]MBE3141011.1 hypothetical protein [Thermoplasmata archaeon]
MPIKIEEDNFTLDIKDVDVLTGELVMCYIEHKIKLIMFDTEHKTSKIVESYKTEPIQTDAQEIQKKEEPLEKPNDVWTKKDDEVLKKCYPSMSAPDIVNSEVLPNRSEQAIYDRANFLGIHKLKQNEKKKHGKITNPPLLLRAPNKTKIFLDWLEEERIKTFNPKDFLSMHQDVTETELTKIIAHQIELARLQQLSNDELRVIGYRG